MQAQDRALMAELRAIRVELERLKPCDKPAVVTYKEAAKSLAVSLETLRRMVARNQLRAVMVCDRPRIPASELERFLAPVESKSRPARVRKSAKYSSADETAKYLAELHAR